MGDFNGDIDDFPVLANVINDEGWHDLGAIANQWGQPQNAPTCLPNGGNPSRRDYIIADVFAIGLVEKIRGCTTVDIGNHGILQVAVRLGALANQTTSQKCPKQLAQAFDEKRVTATHGKTDKEAADIRKQLKNDLHECIDEMLVKHSPILNGAKDTEMIWTTWSRAVEEGFMICFEFDEDAAQPYQEHGKIKLGNAKEPDHVPQGKAQDGRDTETKE